VGKLGHEHVADNPEVQLDPKIIQSLKEFLFSPRRRKIIVRRSRAIRDLVGYN
jgi:hypothetical protein